MSKNKLPNENNTELFFGIPDDDNVTDADFAKADANEFEFVMSLDDSPEETTDNTESSVKEEETVPDKKVTESKPQKPAKKEKADKEKVKKPEKDEKKKADTVSVKKEKAPQSTAAFIATVTLKLLLICAVVATMLAFVYKITDPIIKENEYRKKEAAIAEFFPEKTSFEEISVENEDIDELFIVRNDIEPIGYCASVSPSGFGGGIKMMVGVTWWGKTVIGLKVIEHSETAGVGTKALSGEYLSKYIGEGGDLIKLGSTIDACAGATVTSKAVNAGINSALSVYDEVVGDVSVEPIQDVKPEGTVSIDEALHGADGYGGFYGWIIDVEHTENLADPNFSPFEEIYLSKAKNDNGSYTDHGFAAVVTVTGENGWAKIMVGTYYNTQLGIRFLDYEGDGFKALALDTEYLKNYKMNIADPEPLVYGENIPVHTQADAEARMLAEKAAEVLAYYPEYIAQVTASEEVDV